MHFGSLRVDLERGFFQKVRPSLHSSVNNILHSRLWNDISNIPVTTMNTKIMILKTLNPYFDGK
jgi:hypothetical protein